MRSLLGRDLETARQIRRRRSAGLTDRLPLPAFGLARAAPDVTAEKLPAEENVPPNYRTAEDDASCSTCLFFNGKNRCFKYDSTVQAGMVSDGFEAAELDLGDDASPGAVQEAELFLSATLCEVEELEDGKKLIWGDALREGDFVENVLPDKFGRPVRTRLKVVDGRSNDPSKAVGLDDILDAHNDGLYDHVTVPLSHKDQPHENTGYVKQVVKVEDPDRPGKKKLRTGHFHTKKGIEESVLDGSIANRSCGLRFFQRHHETGKVYPTSLSHLALTNKPWLPGMRPFSAGLSDDQVVSLTLADETHGSPEGGDQMKPGEGEENEATTADSTEKLRDLELKLSRQEEELATERARSDQLARTVHTQSVEGTVKGFQESGLPTGVCTRIREVLLADDGGPVLNLSDEKQNQSLTDVFTHVVDAFDKIDATTLKLSDQVEDPAGGTEEERPKDGPDGGEETKSREDQATEARAAIGDTDDDILGGGS